VLVALKKFRIWSLRWSLPLTWCNTIVAEESSVAWSRTGDAAGAPFD